MPYKQNGTYYIPTMFKDKEGNTIVAGSLVKVIKIPPAKTFIGRVLNFHVGSITIFNFDTQEIVAIQNFSMNDVSRIIRWEIEDRI